MGNPHAVVFMNNVDSLDIDKVGPEFEHDKIFPERVNAEFIKAPAKLGLAAPVLVQQQLRLFLTDSAKRTRKYLLYLREALLR